MEIYTAAGKVAEALEGTDITGVLSEMLALVPLLLPVSVSFIAIRKGISFVLSTLRDA